MRFPSFEVAGRAASAVLVRHPFPLVAAMFAAGAGWGLVGGGDEAPLIRVLFSATLGLPLFVALGTFASRREGSPLRRWVLPALGVLALVAFWMATAAWADPILVRRYAQINLALHAIVAVLAYAGHDEPRGFWQFNRRLFERFLVSALFSAVLFLGLALAIAAVDKLFGVDVDEEYYGRLWFLIAFVFNTWYFLGGVPDRLEELDSATEYPAGLKIFAQYILVPLVLVYLVILTAYLGRVALTREWPSGWIGYLVSGVAVLGILALLLVHPVRNRPENRWVATFARGFWFALVPALAMLFAAIFQRIDQYGITENRYFLFVFAAWLTGLSVFFIVRRSGSIAVIPWSLAAVALGTAFGPWGAYAVSEGSQARRLQGLLERHGLLAEPAASSGTAAAEVPFEDRREIGAGIRYLIEHHGPDRLGVWFAGRSAACDSVLADLEDTGRHRRDVDPPARVLMAALGVDYVDRWANPEAEVFSVNTRSVPTVVDVRDWDYLINVSNFRPDAGVPGSPGGTDVSGGDARFRVAADASGDDLVVWDGEEVVLRFPLAEILERGRAVVRETGDAGNVPAEALRFERAASGVRGVLQITWLNSGREGERDVLIGLNATVLLSVD